MLLSLASAALAGALRAQEAPPPAPAPTDTEVPGEAPRSSFLPTASLRIFTNGNTNVVGDGQSAVGASVALSLPLRWIRPLSSWGLSYHTAASVYGQDDPTNDLDRNLSASYTRTLSRRSSLGFNVNGSMSEQQGFDENLVDQAITLAPRTDVLHLHASGNANFATGKRSFLDVSIRGGIQRYDDITVNEDANFNGVLDPGEDLDGDNILDRPFSFVDSYTYGGHLGWGMTVSERTSVGLGYGYGRITYEDTGTVLTEDANRNGVLDPSEDLNGNLVLDPGEDLNGNGLLDLAEDRNGNGTIDPLNPAALDTTVHTAYFNGTRRFSEFTTGSLGLGVLVAQQEGAEDRLEPSLSASLTRQVSEQSTLSFGLRQSAGMGIGNGIATLDRGLYGTWAWGRPEMGASVGLAYWNRETLIDPLGTQDETTSTFQITESFSWTPGPRFSYGVFHSFRNQFSDDPGFDSSGYNSGGVFARWNIRGRSERGG